MRDEKRVVLSYPSFALLVPLCLLAIVFYPGIHSYDSLEICSQIVLSELSNWHPVYQQLLIKLLDKLGHSLSLLYVFNFVLFAVSLTTLVNLIGVENKILAAVFALAFLLSPQVFLSTVYITKDSLVLSLFILLTVVSWQQLGYHLEGKSNRRSKPILVIIAILMIRPTLVLAVLPFLLLTLYPSFACCHKGQLCFKSSYKLVLISAVSIFLLAVLHIHLKSMLLPRTRVLSGSAYHVYLHDLALSSALHGKPLEIKGFPNECRLSAAQLKKTSYPSSTRIESKLNELSSSHCYTYSSVKQGLLRRAWINLILEQPLSYLWARLTFAKIILKEPRELRGYPNHHWAKSLGEMPFEAGVVKRCIGEDKLNSRLARFPLRVFEYIQGSIFSSGYFALVFYVLGFIAALRGNVTSGRPQRYLAVAVLLSGLLYLVTIVGIAPTTSYRYLRWFSSAGLIGFFLSLIAAKRLEANS